MHLELCIDQRALRNWHLDLLRRLDRLPGFSVGIRWAPPAEPLPSCVATLFALERIVHRARSPGTELVEPTEVARHVGEGGVEPDIVLDLAGSLPVAGRRRWQLTFDGHAGEAAAIAALLDGRTPQVAVMDCGSGEVLACGHPGVEMPHVTVAAFGDVLARAITLVESAVLQRPVSRPGEPVAATLSCGDVARVGAKAMARAALHRIYRILYRTPHWRTGWRRVVGPDVIDLGAHPETGWTDLPDDGLRFYADPFPIVVGGQPWMFVEDLEHRTGKGIISAVAVRDDGPAGTPEPVLELPYHLSYPFLIEQDGEIFMIPESSLAGRVDLFRATKFPGGWAHEATLLDGVEASDATPFRFGGRWWMTATVRDGGSYSDALHLWSAAALHGPWTPHRANPVLVDVASARPAGRVVERGGRLIRPVQDCRGGYGSALALAEVTRLDDEAFSQRVTARITAGARWAGRRIHTLNRAGPIECIDGSAFAPRLRLGRARRNVTARQEGFDREKTLALQPSSELR